MRNSSMEALQQEEPLLTVLGAATRGVDAMLDSSDSFDTDSDMDSMAVNPPSVHTNEENQRMRMMAVAVVVGMLLMSTIQPTTSAYKVALLIIDVQECFLPEGGLPVPEGQQVIPVINRMREVHDDLFSVVALSQDWHCPDHVSFARQHPGLQPFSTVNLTYNEQGVLCFGEHVPRTYPHAIDCDREDAQEHRTLTQTLWPDHCVINATSGPTSAQFSPLLKIKNTDIIVRKGDSCGLDSYSAFFDNGGFHQTELHKILVARDIDLVVVTGLALDFCVYYTSRDAHFLGYKVLTVTDASRGVNPESTDTALKDLKSLGVELIRAKDLESRLRDLNRRLTDINNLSYTLTLLAGALFTAYFLLRNRP